MLIGFPDRILRLFFLGRHNANEVRCDDVSKYAIGQAVASFHTYLDCYRGVIAKVYSKRIFSEILKKVFLCSMDRGKKKNTDF